MEPNTIDRHLEQYLQISSPKAIRVKHREQNPFIRSDRRECRGWTESFFGDNLKLPNCLECAQSCPITPYYQGLGGKIIQIERTPITALEHQSTHRCRSFLKTCWSNFTGLPISISYSSSSSTGFQLLVPLVKRWR